MPAKSRVTRVTGVMKSDMLLKYKDKILVTPASVFSQERCNFQNRCNAFAQYRESVSQEVMDA
ncbi:hypothetical protein D3C73_644560 [compost metagenome]